MLDDTVVGSTVVLDEIIDSENRKPTRKVPTTRRAARQLCQNHRNAVVPIGQL